MKYMQFESDIQRVGNCVFNKGGNKKDEEAWMRLKKNIKPYVCECNKNRTGGMKWWNEGAKFCGDCGGEKPKLEE